VLRRAVAFGGSSSCAANVPTNDTWEWHGATWSQPTVSGDLPSPRLSMAMTFDRKSGVALVHGGWVPPDNPQEGTYTYDLETHTWASRGASPSFADSYDTNTQWDYCNGAYESSSPVRLMYR